MALLECPMCDFTVLPTDDYILQLHFEQVHTTDSPFIIHDDPEPLPTSLSPRPSSSCKHERDTTSSDEEDDTVICSEPDCGEVVLLVDLNDHLDYHAAESLSFDETTGQYHSHHSSSKMRCSSATSKSPKSASTSSRAHSDFDVDSNDGHSHKTKKKTHRDRRGTNSSEKSTLSRSIVSFNPFAKSEKSAKPPSKSARLGRSELGPYAWEDQMPRWLHDQLDAGPKITVVNRIGRDGRLIKQEQVQNETPGIIPILAQLSALDRNVKEAYYCHPSAVHIGKTPKEGSFCGYRNIQMLLSYIQGAKAQGHEEFPGRMPGILKLQELIEKAWDRGINHVGRVQTGGIQDTRKYIGTPEAQALFLSSEINCAVEMFSDRETSKGKVQAHDQLLRAVERYFAQAAVSDDSNVHKTYLPPIYLQRPGHSLTIVGIERRRDGTSNLVVLDPMYSTSPAMHRLIGRKSIKTARPEVLHAYRRGPSHLRKFAAFEILILTATPPLFPAWDVLRQFPDCRYVYALFRSRTLGYDVYPEDYFLRTFPWQQYGGLWVVDEARFAREGSLDTLTAQTLRRITGEGASPPSSDSDSPISPLSDGSFRHFPETNDHMRNLSHSQFSSLPNSFNSSTNSFPVSTQYGSSNSTFEIASPTSAIVQAAAPKPQLTLLTDVGRRYPGFPTPLSPTLSAKDLFPSPTSDAGSWVASPRVLSPGVRSLSPMSLDGSEMCGPSRRCNSHGYDHYAAGMGLIDSIIAQSSTGYGLMSPPQTPLLSPLSPTSPVSPRSAMMRNKFDRQLPNPVVSLAPGLQYHPSTVNAPGTFTHAHTHPVQSLSPPSPGGRSLSSVPVIQIANGTEAELESPYSPSGTMLSYTSNRAIGSGLLAVPPLSEPRVAEYRFWVPCGRKTCTFGCGVAHEGETAASKRLFKEVEEVKEQTRADGDEKPGQNEVEGGKGTGKEKPKSPAVTNWAQFLRNRERQGIALV